jgi:hypothetical protein
MAAAERDLATNAATPDTLGDRAAKIMEDPFHSMYAALVSTGAAVAAVVSGILGLSVIH